MAGHGTGRLAESAAASLLVPPPPAFALLAPPPALLPPPPPPPPPPAAAHAPASFVLPTPFASLQGKVVAQVNGHDDDVNAVAYLEPGSPHTLVSGSDDTFVKVGFQGTNSCCRERTRAAGAASKHTLDGHRSILKRSRGVNQAMHE